MSRKYPKNQPIHELTAGEKSAIEHEYQMDHQMVKGVFKNFQQKNNPIRFVFRKYGHDPIEWYPKDILGKKQYFQDGKTYEIPLMVANHLNNACYRPVQQNQLDPVTGKPIPEVMVGSKNHRFGFINTDFRPVAGWKDPSPIVTVNQKIL
jgi:hypothetical protein